MTIGKVDLNSIKKYLAQLYKKGILRYTELTSPQKQKVKYLLYVLAFLIILILVKGCQILTSSNIKPPPPPVFIRSGDQIQVPEHSALRKDITITTVRNSYLAHEVSFPGVIEAKPTRTVNILPPLTGRLISLNAQLGDKVKQNQLLAIIYSPDLAQAYADKKEADSTLKLNQAAYVRAKKVQLVGGNAIKDVQVARDAYIHALAEANRSQARLKALGNLGDNKLAIKSPISGQVTALNYGVGSYINDITANLISISNLKKVWVNASIPENYIHMIKIGQKVNVSLAAYPDLIFKGKIKFISAILDPQTRTNQTRISLTNLDGKLQPNMFAMVKVTIPETCSINVPITAILMNDDVTSIYVEKSPWVFERRSVVLGLEDNDTVRVLSGLKVGDRIASCGGIFIND